MLSVTHLFRIKYINMSIHFCISELGVSRRKFKRKIMKSPSTKKKKKNSKKCETRFPIMKIFNKTFQMEFQFNQFLLSLKEALKI